MLNQCRSSARSGHLYFPPPSARYLKAGQFIVGKLISVNSLDLKITRLTLAKLKLKSCSKEGKQTALHKQAQRSAISQREKEIINMKYKLNQYLLTVILTIFAIGCTTTQSESTTQSEIITVESNELITAVSYGKTDTVKALLEAGADVNATDTRGATALRLASLYGHTETVKALVAAGAVVNAKDNSGETALMAAITYGHTEIVKALLEAGADVNATNARGATALMFASDEGNTEIVKALLEAGADVNMEDNRGGTALKSAKRSKHKAIVQLLEEAGARKSFERKELKELKVLNEDRLHARVQEMWAAFGRGDVDTYVSFLDPYHKKAAKSEGLTLREFIGYETPDAEITPQVLIATITKICSCSEIVETSVDTPHTSCHLNIHVKNETSGDEGDISEEWSNRDGEWFWNWATDFTPC